MIAANSVAASGLLLHILYIASALTCALTSFRSKRVSPFSSQVPPYLFATGATIWVLVGVIALTNYLASGSAAVPLWAEYLHFCWIIPVVMAVIVSMRRLRFVFDQSSIVAVLVTAVSVLGLYWSTVIHTVWFDNDASVGLTILNVLFPLGNVVVMSLLYLYLVSRPGIRLRELFLFGFGYAFVGFSDASLILHLNDGNYSTLGAYNIGYWVGPLLIATGMRVRYTTKSPSEVTPTIVFPDRYFTERCVPYLPLIAYSIFKTFNSRDNREQLFTTLLMLIGILLLVFAICKYHLLNARARVLLEGNVVAQSTELARSHLLNQRIIGVAADGIVAVDPFDHVVLINRAALDILGYVPDGAGVPTIPSHVHELFHRDTNCPGHCSLNDILHDTSSEAHTVTLVIPRKQIIIELSVRPLDGSTSGFVLVFHDITEQVSLAKLKDEFVLLVSHEIRTPLTSIRGSLGLLEHGVLGEFPDEARNMISVALQNSDRLLRLINDVLDLERMETGKRQMDLQWQTVEAIFDEVAKGLLPLARESGIALVSDHRDCSVMVDYDCIVQVLVNLVQNAIKFSPPNSTVTLTVDTFKDHAMFSVQDEGRGIPVDHLDKVFEAFHQVDASNTRDKSGTGLGLAISREIVESHGGRIWAEARPVRGSAFHFTVPHDAQQQASRLGHNPQLFQEPHD